MDEILFSVQQRLKRVTQIQEKTDPQDRISIIDQVISYDQIRKHKEEEKNRIDKENWIINIIKNIKSLNNEQQMYNIDSHNEIRHIYEKTKEIMIILQPELLRPFEEEYISLFDNFSSLSDSLYKPKTKPFTRREHVGILITELLKNLINLTRQKYQISIQKLSEQVTDKMKSASSEQKLYEKIMVRQSKGRLKTSVLQPKNHKRFQRQVNIISQSMTRQSDTDDMEENYIKINPNKSIQRQLHQEFREDVQLQMHKIKSIPTNNKMMTEQIMILNDTQVDIPQGPKLITEEKQKITSPQSYFTFIQDIIHDLDEQFCIVMEYQSIKRPNQTADETKNTIDHFYEKIKYRNIYIQNSCQMYRQYINPIISDGYTETATHLISAFEKINNLCCHLCLITMRPNQGQVCECQVDGFYLKIPFASKLMSYSPKKALSSNIIQQKGYMVRRSCSNLKKHSESIYQTIIGENRPTTNVFKSEHNYTYNPPDPSYSPIMIKLEQRNIRQVVNRPTLEMRSILVQLQSKEIKKKIKTNLSGLFHLQQIRTNGILKHEKNTLRSHTAFIQKTPPQNAKEIVLQIHKLKSADMEQRYDSTLKMQDLMKNIQSASNI